MGEIEGDIRKKTLSEILKQKLADVSLGELGIQREYIDSYFLADTVSEMILF